MDIKQLAEEKMPGSKLCVCANLPYNITSPAIAAFIDAAVFESITVMVQREVARRICAEPGTPEYGAFTVFVNYYTEPEILFDVPPECFLPRPKVYSSVLKMKTRAERELAGAEERLFFKIVRAAFGQRRKTLVNSIYSVFSAGYNKEDITKIIIACGFDARVRGEALNIKDYVEITTRFTHYLP